MRVAKDFILAEFVPEEAFKRLGAKALWLINPSIINAAQQIRNYFGKPVNINTWHLGNNQKQWCWRGFRGATYNKCSPFSQHKLGNAIDFTVLDMDALEVQKVLIDNPKLLKKFGITAIENGTPTWTHVDVRNNNGELLVIPFKVTKVIKS